MIRDRSETDKPNSLIIDNKPWTTIRFVIGLLFFIGGIAHFIANIDHLKAYNYLISGSYLFVGIINMANDFGFSKTYFRIVNDKLILKKTNRLTKICLTTSKIKSISFQKTQIVIELFSTKEIKIFMKSFNQIQSNQIINFFSVFSRDHDIPMTNK